MMAAILCPAKKFLMSIASTTSPQTCLLACAISLGVKALPEVFCLLHHVCKVLTEQAVSFSVPIPLVASLVVYALGNVVRDVEGRL